MASGWVLLCTIQEEYKGAIIESALAEVDIICMLNNRRDSAYRLFGEIEVYVKQTDYLAARHILEKLNL